MLNQRFDRRDFLKLTGIGGAVLVSGRGPWGRSLAAGGEDFFFVQMTDTPWGFEGPPNPEAKNTLRKGVAAVNSFHAAPTREFPESFPAAPASDDQQGSRPHR